MSVPGGRPIPVFPLPDVVLFPRVRLTLHVFELRYRTLVRTALLGAREFAIATLKPGWEQDYHGSPEFHDMACIARFEQVQWLPDDCFDLEVEGAERVRLGRVVREFPYRACEGERLRSAPWDADDPLAAMEHRALLATARALAERGGDLWWGTPDLGDGVPFETLVNALAQAVRIPVPQRLELLAFDSVFDRARRLQEHLKRLAVAAAPSPPEGDIGRN